MTRIASIMGVAVVATLVLLSGCEQAVETDYTKKLDGTWTVTGLMVPGADPTTQIPTDVTIVIDDGTGLNSGTFSLTVSQVVPPLPDRVDTAVGEGSVKAESSSVLKVTLTDLTLTGLTPQQEQAVKGIVQGMEHTFDYDLEGDTLKVSSQILSTLRVTSAADEELTLRKQ